MVILEGVTLRIDHPVDCSRGELVTHVRCASCRIVRELWREPSGEPRSALGPCDCGGRAWVSLPFDATAPGALAYVARVVFPHTDEARALLAGGRVLRRAHCSTEQ